MKRLILVVVLFLSACGSNNGSTPTNTTPPAHGGPQIRPAGFENVSTVFTNYSSFEAHHGPQIRPFANVSTAAFTNMSTSK